MLIGREFYLKVWGNNMRKTIQESFFCLLLATMILGWAPLIAPFNETAYEQAVSLKVESLALMDKATHSFANHQTEVEGLIVNLNKAYEFAKGRPRNEISTRMWEILKDSDRHLLGRFLERWRKEGTLSKGYVEEKKLQVADAFDKIIGLESGKLKPSDFK